MKRWSALLPLVALLALAGCTLNNDPVPAGPVTIGLLPGEVIARPDQTPSAERGHRIYAAHCIHCHGADGLGATPLAAQLATLGADVPGLIDPALEQDRGTPARVQLIGEGGAFMPAFTETLDLQQRWDVTAYLDSLASSPDTVDDLAAPSRSGEFPPGPRQPNTLAGHVINQSGGSLPAGLGVTLRGFVDAPADTPIEFFVRSTLTDNTGAYQFTDVPLDQPDAWFQVSTHYANVTYTAHAPAPAPDGSLILDLPVYESGSDPALLVIEHLGLLLRSQPGALHVTQLLAYRAAGDQVYITPEPVRGGEHGGVIIELPPGAYGLELEGGQAGGRFIVEGSQVYDTRHVLPAADIHTITLRYLLPVNASGAFTLTIPHEMSTFNLLVQEGYNENTGAFVVIGAHTLNGEQYSHLVARNLLPGTITINAGRPIAANETSSVVMLIAAISLGILLAIGGILRQGRQRRIRRMARVLAQTEGQQVHLLRELAALDAAYQAGKLDRFAYELRRAAKKAELVAYLEHL